MNALRPGITRSLSGLSQEQKALSPSDPAPSSGCTHSSQPDPDASCTANAWLALIQISLPSAENCASTNLGEGT
eukprot:2460679-Rhodomonas_salina.4